mmetsp:Transcript_24332/g.72227  ORF Transcript_24332/g.72227 Transcript_24332/m.72227 type:complete len:202 (-) Transcript_24332:92-697(-)
MFCHFTHARDSTWQVCSLCGLGGGPATVLLSTPSIRLDLICNRSFPWPSASCGAAAIPPPPCRTKTDFGTLHGNLTASRVAAAADSAAPLPSAHSRCNRSCIFLAAAGPARPLLYLMLRPRRSNAHRGATAKVEQCSPRCQSQGRATPTEVPWRASVQSLLLWPLQPPSTRQGLVLLCADVLLGSCAAAAATPVCFIAPWH